MLKVIRTLHTISKTEQMLLVVDSYLRVIQKKGILQYVGLCDKGLII